MDNKVTKNLSATQKNNRKELSDALISKKIATKCEPNSDTFDEKDMLIAQLQEQIAKQRECILYYESIVQLMNFRLMKLKKVLKAHELLEELD